MNEQEPMQPDEESGVVFGHYETFRYIESPALPPYGSSPIKKPEYVKAQHAMNRLMRAMLDRIK